MIEMFKNQPLSFAMMESNEEIRYIVSDYIERIREESGLSDDEATSMKLLMESLVFALRDWFPRSCFNFPMLYDILRMERLNQGYLSHLFQKFLDVLSAESKVCDTTIETGIAIDTYRLYLESDKDTDGRRQLIEILVEKLKEVLVENEVVPSQEVALK